MIVKSIHLPLAPAAAFDLVTRRIGEWWPPERRHTNDPRSEIFLLASGRFYERARDGSEVELGCVRSWDVPNRILLDFFIATGPERPTEVEITFVAHGAGAEVTVVHRPKLSSEALWGERAPRYERAWTEVLAALSANAHVTIARSSFAESRNVMTVTKTGLGAREDPWRLETPSRQGEFTAWRDEAAEPAALVVQVGKTELRYRLRCLEDLAAMLKAHGDWAPLGSADEQKPAAPGTVEAWARSADNPVGGWYGLKKGLRGRFANYVPPVMEVLGLAEVEHNPKNNRMRGKISP